MAEVELEWTEDEAPEPGVYYAEVKSVEMRHSKEHGHQFLSIEYKDAPSGEFLCFDIAMLEGKGRGIGLKKLELLGIPRDTKSLETNALVGRRVHLQLEEQEYRGEKKLGVAFEGGERFGYWPHDMESPPDGVEVLSLKKDLPF